MFMSARQLAKKSSVTENNKVRCLAAAAGGIAADRKSFAALASGDREGRQENLFSPRLETNSRSPSAAYHWGVFGLFRHYSTPWPWNCHRHRECIPARPALAPIANPWGKIPRSDKRGTLESNNPIIQ